MQEAALRLEEAEVDEDGRERWPKTGVARLSIDELRSARCRRETYAGEWLTEPVWRRPDPEQKAITKSKLGIGLLYLLERLEPHQRAVFVLREVFEQSYADIATMLDKSEAAWRQLMVRAKEALRKAAPRGAAAAPELVCKFTRALESGDPELLVSVLSHHAVLISDGGGKVQSALRPISGADKIVWFYVGMRRKHPYVRLEHRLTMVNGEIGIATYRDGELHSLMALEGRGNVVTGVYIVTNPDKLDAENSATESSFEAR